MNPFRRHRPRPASEIDTLILDPAPAFEAHHQLAVKRATDAEEALDVMLVRLNAAVRREQVAIEQLTRALADNESLHAEVVQLAAKVEDQRIELTRVRGAAVRCPVCRDPLPWGTPHYCHRTSEIREDAA